MLPSPVWAARRERVERLRGEHPHATELAFYRDVLALQEPLYGKALNPRWLRAVEAADGRPPRLRLSRCRNGRASACAERRLVLHFDRAPCLRLFLSK